MWRTMRSCGVTLLPHYSCRRAHFKSVGRASRSPAPKDLEPKPLFAVPSSQRGDLLRLRAHGRLRTSGGRRTGAKGGGGGGGGGAPAIRALLVDLVQLHEPRWSRFSPHLLGRGPVISAGRAAGGIKPQRQCQSFARAQGSLLCQDGRKKGKCCPRAFCQGAYPGRLPSKQPQRRERQRLRARP